MTEVRRSGDIQVVRFGEANIQVQVGSEQQEREEDEEGLKQLPESTLFTRLLSASPRRSLLKS